MPGSIVAIHIASEAGGPMRALPEVLAVEGRGLEGDRYFARRGTYSKGTSTGQQVTLIESEALEALLREYDVELSAAESRRNLATRGVALNHLVGARFRVGEAVLRGTRLCEPCGHMERLAGKPAKKGLVHRGGLNADVLQGGRIRVGDAVEPLDG